MEVRHTALIIIDDLTRLREVYFLSAKSSTLLAFQRYTRDMRTLLRGMAVQGITTSYMGTPVSMRSDNGGEFIGQDFIAFCDAQGIRQQFTGPYCPQQNGVAERTNRTVLESARSMLLGAALQGELWVEAFKTAVYLINRLPTRALDGDTPYHALRKEHAKLDHLKVFGCLAYVQIPEQQRSKLGPKAWRGIMVGYDATNRSCYRVFDPGGQQVHRVVHITFDEDVMPAKRAPEQPAAVQIQPKPTITPSPTTAAPVGAAGPVGAAAGSTVTDRRGRRPAPDEW